MMKALAIMACLFWIATCLVVFAWVLEKAAGE